MSTGGYTTVFHEGGGKSDHGVAIAYRTDSFQMAELRPIDLNDVAHHVRDHNFATRCQQDNAALLMILKPWETSTFPTALCIATFQLASDPQLEEVRMLQAKYLCSAIEVFNRNFQVPVIFAGSLNAPPGSDIYHVVLTGRPRPVPQPPQPPDRPVASKPTSTSLTLTWQTPKSEVHT